MTTVFHQRCQPSITCEPVAFCGGRARFGRVAEPVAAMVRDGREHLVLTLRKVTDVIDGGEFVARSHAVAIPAGVNAVQMHRITWPQMGLFIRREVTALLDAGNRIPTPEPMLPRDESAPSRLLRSRMTADGLAV